MMKIIGFLLLGALLAPLYAAPVPKDKTPPLKERLLGSWVVKTRETADLGTIADAENTTWTISEGKLVSTRGGGPSTWTLTLNDEAIPAQYDLKLGASGYTGLIEVDGDTLRVCHTMVGIRPKEFSTKEGAEIVVLQRSRP